VSDFGGIGRETGGFWSIGREWGVIQGGPWGEETGGDFWGNCVRLRWGDQGDMWRGRSRGRKIGLNYRYKI